MYSRGARVDTIFEEMQHQADRDMDQMAVHAEETGGRISGAFGKAAGLAKTGLLGIAAGLGTAAVFGLKSAATLEQVQISFESLTGSVAAGTKQFKDLQQFAAATPFEFKDLTTAAQRFDAFSAAIGQSKQQLIPFLTTIGNLVSETGGGAQALDSISLALGQTASQGKLTLGNLNQINNAIPGFSSVAALAAVRGETTAQVMKEISSGAIDAKTGINQLLVGMQKFPGAAGAMQKQSETLLGVFSTFSDTVSQALAGAFAPVIPLIKDSLTKITPIIGQALTVLGPALGKLISSVLPVLASLLQGIVPIIVPILDALTQAFAIIGPVLAPLGAALGLILKALEPLVPILANILVAAVNALIPVIVALAPVIGELAKPIGDILIALAPLIPPLGELLVAVVQLLEPFIKLLALISKWNTKLISAEVKVAVPLIQALADGVAWLAKWIDKIDWKAVGKAIVDFVKSVGSFFVGLWNDITGFFKAIPKWLGQVGSFFAGIWDKVVGFFEGLPDKIGNFLSSLPGKLQEAAVRAFDLFFQAVGYGIGLILKEFMALPGQVMSFVKTLWANVVNGFNKGVAFLESLPGRIWKLITGLWDGAVKLTSTGIANIIGFVVGLYHGIVNWFTKAWDTGKARFLKGVDDVVSFAKALPGRVVAWISQLPGKISTAVSGAGKWLYDAGKNIIMGLIHGIEDFVGSAIDTIKRAMGSVIKGAMSALGQHSPSKVFAEIGHNVVLGYIKGVEGGTGDAVAATSQMVSPRGQSFASPVIGPGGGMPVHVTVNFNGAVPTPAEAFTTGQAAGRGVASALATQAARNRVRTM
ncbi:MAG TPA: tape measure protein [Acidimicrobiales bacterium]|nr:tape measure protein [Acidimicrobiales bacterium]